MSSTATGFRGMPGAGSKEAPSFSGCAGDLLDFFTQFEDLANSCGLTIREQCRTVLRYIDSAMKRLWISLPEYDAADYKAFKARVINEYPGTEKGMQYTYRNLERIVLTHADLDISTETELMEFSRQFRPVATWLVKNNKISERERDKLFWQGLPRHIRHAISLQLQLEDPKKFDHTEHPNFEKVIRAGRVVLANDQFDVDKNDPVTLRLHSVRDSVPLSDIKTAPLRPSYNKDKYCYPGDARQEVQTKTVRFDESKALIDEVDKLSWCISRLDVHDSAYARCYAHLICLSTATAKIWPLPAGARPRAAPVHQTFSTAGSAAVTPPSSNCFMCGGPHLVSQCHVINDYICTG